MNKIVNGEVIEMTPEEIAEWEASQQPIVEQLPDATLVLSTVFDSQPAELRAMFAPLRAAVNLELELGNYDVVRLIIQGATVPEELEPLRQQLLALLEGY